MAPERQKSESAKAWAACNDYLRMGPGRSLAKLHEWYQIGAESGPGQPPTQRLNTLKAWSTQYDWQTRAAAYDAEIEAEKEARSAACRRQIMEEGFALDYERVKKLKALAVLLGDEIIEEDKRWLPDVKQIGGGEFAEKVDIVRFNSALIEQFRGVLDDIAKETGGRKHKMELSGQDGGAIQIVVKRDSNRYNPARAASGPGADQTGGESV